MIVDRLSQPGQPTRTNRAFAWCAALTLVVILVLLPFAIFGSLRGLQAMNNHPLTWMPRDTDSRRQYEEFVSHFEHYDPVIVSWEGCTVDDDRLDHFARRLESYEDPHGGLSGQKLFERVITGRDLLRELTSPPLRLSREVAVGRLRGSMIGDDGRATCAIVVLTPEAAKQGGATLDVIYEVAQNECDLDRDALRVGGSAVESAELDKASVSSLVDNLLPSAVAVLLVAWLFLRSLWLTVLVNVAALSVEALALSLVYFSGAEMNGILVVMPSLIFVIFVAGAVHLLNYYEDALRDVGPELAPGTAVRVGWLPCTLATLTTAIGTASLATSGIAPVVVFAEFATIGIVAALGALFLVIPGAMVLRSRLLRGAAPRPLADVVGLNRTAGWDGLARGVTAGRVVIVAGFLLAMAWGAVGVTKLKASMQLRDFFMADTRIVRDHQWLEDTIGPLLPAEVVLRFDDRTDFDMHDRLVLVRDIASAIEAVDSAGATMSAATLLPFPARGSHAGAIARRVVLERRLAKRVDDLIGSNYMARDGGDQLWRISARVYALAPIDYGEALAQLRSAVAGVLADAGLTSDDVTVTYTGMLPMTVESRRQLLRDLAMSFALALVIIAVVLAIAFRSVRFGLLSLLPNVFPTLLVLGGLGWLGWHIDIGSMMTASVGLGIAVDDTVHYLTWYRRGVAEGLLPAEAVQVAYRRCGGAMVRTTLICGAGLVVFMFSPLLPAAQFSQMICVLLAMSLLGDLVFLPALLCALSWRRPRAAEDVARSTAAAHPE